MQRGKDIYPPVDIRVLIPLFLRKNNDLKIDNTNKNILKGKNIILENSFGVLIIV